VVRCPVSEGDKVLTLQDAVETLHDAAFDGYVITTTRRGGRVGMLAQIADLAETALVTWADEREVGGPVRVLDLPSPWDISRVRDELLRVTLIVPVGAVEGKPGRRVLSVGEHMIRATLSLDTTFGESWGGALRCVEATPWIGGGFFVVSRYTKPYEDNRPTPRNPAPAPAPADVPLVFKMARDLSLETEEQEQPDDK
jgi:hypothetical protein